MKDLRMLIYKGNTIDMFPGLGPIDYNEVKLSGEHLTINCFTVDCIFFWWIFSVQYLLSFGFPLISQLGCGIAILWENQNTP